MDEFGCDYACRTVGESMTKYNIPDDWCAEFDAYDEGCPIIIIQAAQIRKSPEMMDLKLRMIENPEDEYAGCMVITEKTLLFNGIISTQSSRSVCSFNQAHSLVQIYLPI